MYYFRHKGAVMAHSCLDLPFKLFQWSCRHCNPSSWYLSHIFLWTQQSYVEYVLCVFLSIRFYVMLYPLWQFFSGVLVCSFDTNMTRMLLYSQLFLNMFSHCLDIVSLLLLKRFHSLIWKRTDSGALHTAMHGLTPTPLPLCCYWWALCCQ